jgi:predicted kinase
LSPAVVKAGFQWDDGMLRAVNAVAEREGVTALVLDGRHVVAAAVSGPPVDAVTAERQLRQRWGSMFPSKLEAAHLAFDALPSAVRADLERRELDVHPAVMDYLARVGEALMDPTTPGGERRLKEKYRQWVESQPR